MIKKNRIEYNTIEWKWQENRSDEGGIALEIIEKKLEREEREEKYEENQANKEYEESQGNKGNEGNIRNEENEINYGIHSKERKQKR